MALCLEELREMSGETFLHAVAVGKGWLLLFFKDRIFAIVSDQDNSLRVIRATKEYLGALLSMTKEGVEKRDKEIEELRAEHKESIEAYNIIASYLEHLA